MKGFILFALLLLSAHSQAQISNESEAGLASANGNTKTQTYNFKQLNNYVWDKNTMTFKSRFLNAFANGNETARYFNAGLRYERELTESISTFIGETFERDKFAGIDKRYITDAGGKYSFIKEETNKWFAELGYRYMAERRYDGTKAYSSYLRAFTEWEKKWNESFSTKYWFELLPNLSNSTDYQYNTEASVSAMLTNIFSLKSGFLLRYDHLPAPGIRHKTDTLLTTALVAKF